MNIPKLVLGQFCRGTYMEYTCNVDWPCPSNETSVNLQELIFEPLRNEFFVRTILILSCTNLNIQIKVWYDYLLLDLAWKPVNQNRTRIPFYYRILWSDEWQPRFHNLSGRFFSLRNFSALIIFKLDFWWSKDCQCSYSNDSTWFLL